MNVAPGTDTHTENESAREERLRRSPITARLYETVPADEQGECLGVTPRGGSLPWWFGGRIGVRGRIGVGAPLGLG